MRNHRPSKVDLGQQPCYSPESLQTLAHFMVRTFHKSLEQAMQTQLQSGPISGLSIISIS